MADLGDHRHGPDDVAVRHEGGRRNVHRKENLIQIDPTPNPELVTAAALAGGVVVEAAPTVEPAAVDDPPLHLESLAVGDQWTSPWREVSGEDVAAFAALTGDDDPLHTEDGGADSPFGEPVAHGLLGLSLMAGQSVRYPSVATLALVGVQDWTFEHPIFFGDRVRTITEVESITPHGRRAGRVVWHRRLVNGDGRTVQRGRIVTLVARRTRAVPR